MARFRMVMAGLGFVSRFWLPALKAEPDVEIVGVADPNTQQAESTMQQWGLSCPLSLSLEEALKVSEANLVVNLTPYWLHRRMTEVAMTAGCHVLTEKPIASTFEDALAMVELSERTGLQLSVMQNRRFVPGIRRLAEGVASGAIGDPAFISADMFMWSRHAPAYLNHLDSPLLQDMAIHTFDAARFLSGSDALAVVCSERNPPHSWYPGPASATCTFEMANGGLFSYRGSWVAKGCETGYDAVWRVSGSEGTACWDSWGEPTCEVGVPEELGDPPVDRHVWEVTAKGTGHARCLREMLDGLREGRPSETNGRDNLRSVAMMFAAIRSSRERRWVGLEEFLPIPTTAALKQDQSGLRTEARAEHVRRQR